MKQKEIKLLYGLKKQVNELNRNVIAALYMLIGQDSGAEGGEQHDINNNPNIQRPHIPVARDLSNTRTYIR